jgi:hypothetical protein
MNNGLDDLVPTPQPLPGGPAWERLLFENPLPLVVLLLASAVVVFFVMRRRAKAGIGAAVAGVLGLLAAGAWVLAREVVTVREEVKAAAAELVDAAAKADTARLEVLLDDNAVAYSSAAPGGMLKDRILAEVRRQLGERFRVSRYEIEESQAVVDGPGVARAQLRVWVEETDSRGSLSSWWGLDLKRDSGGGWRTSVIRPLHPLMAARAGR